MEKFTDPISDRNNGSPFPIVTHREGDLYETKSDWWNRNGEQLDTFLHASGPWADADGSANCRTFQKVVSSKACPIDSDDTTTSGTGR